MFLVEIGFHHIGQAGLELLTSGDSPTSASQSAGITIVRSQAPGLKFHFFVLFISTQLTEHSQLIGESFALFGFVLILNKNVLIRCL